MEHVSNIVPCDPLRHRRGVHELLANNGWEERYIAGQLGGLDVLSGDTLPGMCGKVCVSEVKDRLSGFVSVEYREWNYLGQLQGLAVDPDLKRRGIASAARPARRRVRAREGRAWALRRHARDVSEGASVLKKSAIGEFAAQAGAKADLKGVFQHAGAFSEVPIQDRA
jgi:GNAT superfamily N-acetyltransferase